MQVILLATDEEAKLDPLRDTIPGPLVPIVNRPLIAMTAEIVARSGFKHVVVSIGHRGGSIASYCGSGTRWGLHFTYSIQRQGWGSAGALKWATQLLHETFLVLPTDMILDLDIAAALACHQAHDGVATAILQRTSADEPANPVCIDAHGRVLATNTYPLDSYKFCNTGAYIFEPQILPYIPSHTRYNCYSDLIPALIASGQDVFSYVTEGYWNPLDSWRAYQAAQKVFLYNAYRASKPDATVPGEPLPRIRYPEIKGRQVAPGIWVGRNHIIHPSVRLAPPICIGENCWIGREVEIGPEAILGSNVIVDDEATIAQSTILEHTYVGQLVNIDNRIVSKSIAVDPEISQHAHIVDPFLLAETNPATLRSGRIRRWLNVGGAFTLILLTLPIAIPISLIVFFVSGGRLFQRVPRIGRSPRASKPGYAPVIRTFDLLAFQTQHADETESSFGQWLCRRELHRLPELLNVLKEDLALVGVKPLSPEEATQCHEEWHQKRYECPAGFTGLWYIQSGTTSDLEEVLITDAYYAATRTRWNEIKIALQTPVAWLRKQRCQHTQRAERQSYQATTDEVGNL